MIFDLQLDLEAIDREIDALTETREVMAHRLDVLAQHRETKVMALAFESTAYTPDEVRPVNFRGIDYGETEPAQDSAR